MTDFRKFTMFVFHLLWYFSRVNVKNIKTEEEERHDTKMQKWMHIGLP